MGTFDKRGVANGGAAEEWVSVEAGVRLWTASSGVGAIPVVVCHGGAGLWDYLRPVAEMLGDPARVHGWEQRGCGRSDRVGPCSLSRYLADLEFLRRHFGDELQGRPRAEDEERQWRVLSFMPDFGEPRPAPALAAAFAEVPYAINFACKKALNDADETTVEDELLRVCRGLDIPVVVVHGARDPRPVWAVRSLVEALPQAELVALDRTRLTGARPTTRRHALVTTTAAAQVSR